MIAAIIVYTAVFLLDFGKTKGDKNGRRLFLLSATVGIALLTLIQSDIKITAPAVHIMNFLKFAGLHYK